MKIYMLWDMEGVSGLFTREQTWYFEPGVRSEIAEEGQKLMIADVNSAVFAALEAGADEVIVTDTHTGGENIRVSEMLSDRRVTYHVKSSERCGTRRRWMPGLDSDVDGLMLMGHHAKAGTPDAFLPHTWMQTWSDFRINGQSVGEIGIEACYAAHWNIPLALVQGDEATAKEVAEQFPQTVMAAVKRAESHDRCSGPEPDAARRVTARKVSEAIERLRRRQAAAFKPKLPMTVSIRMSSVEAAEAAAKKPGVRRVDDTIVESRVERYCDVVKWIVGAGCD